MTCFSEKTYHFLQHFVGFFMRFLHPVVHVQGRENIPEGKVVVACNHSSISDPVWLHVTMKCRRIPMTMAKKELMDTPVIGKVCEKLGAFPVDRSKADLQAVKTALHCLKDDNKLIIFPEGTRVRRGNVSQPHNGTMLIACRGQAQILPVYITNKKIPFCPLNIIYGKPYTPEIAGKRPTQEELDSLTADLMKNIYKMGEKA